MALSGGPHQETHIRMNTISTSWVVACPPNVEDLHSCLVEAMPSLCRFLCTVLPPEQDAHSHPQLWYLTLDSLQMQAHQEATPVAAPCIPSLYQAKKTPSYPSTSSHKVVGPNTEDFDKNFRDVCQ